MKQAGKDVLQTFIEDTNIPFTEIVFRNHNSTSLHKLGIIIQHLVLLFTKILMMEVGYL